MLEGRTGTRTFPEGGAMVSNTPEATQEVNASQMSEQRVFQIREQKVVFSNLCL